MKQQTLEELTQEVRLLIEKEIETTGYITPNDIFDICLRKSHPSLYSYYDELVWRFGLLKEYAHEKEIKRERIHLIERALENSYQYMYDENRLPNFTPLLISTELNFLTVKWDEDMDEEAISDAIDEAEAREFK